MCSLSVPDGTRRSKAVHEDFVDYFTSQHLICPSRDINQKATKTLFMRIPEVILVN